MRLSGPGAGRLRTSVTTALAAGLLLCGCTNISALQFRTDHHVTFTAPSSRAKTALPVTLRWRVEDFRVAGPDSAEPPSKDAGYFALFVDRAPIKPGQTLAAVAGGDSSCVPAAGCPDRQYLADRQVYWTTGLSYTLRQVDPLDDSDNWQLHEVTIVLLDTSGHRIGEHAYYRDFKLKRSALS
ncbi:MAG TPA: hypothetical protein VHE57_03040 [Mycobacteriales bacterium]|jgi:hypothetical protein|nr:hypothetical protein [Mycobacteriales bacterium]